MSTDGIEFGFKAPSVTGDRTITKQKLTAELAGEYDAKVDGSFLIGQALTEDTPLVLIHNFGERTNYIVQVSYANDSVADGYAIGEIFADEVIKGNGQVTLRTGLSGVTVDVVFHGIS